MKCLFTVLIFLLFAFDSFAQQFYITDRSDIVRITLLSDGSYKSETLKHTGNPDFISIALYKNTLYFNDYNSLYKATIKQDSVVDVNRIAAVDYYPTSLTVDIDGKLYYVINKTLYSCSSTGDVTKLGDMPYESAGDLVFYKGDLYMASLSGIVKVDISNPAASIVYMQDVSGNVLALTSVAFDCNTNKIYGLESVVNDTRVLDIDLDKKTVTVTPYSYPIHSSDAASSVETGAVAGITIDAIENLPVCGTGQSEIQIRASPLSQHYNYTFDGTTNNTGSFIAQMPGRYQITVTSAGGCVKDSFVVIPDFNIKPSHETTAVKPVCENDGQITVKLSDDQFRTVLGADTVGSSHSFKNLPAGFYTFSIINKYNCKVDEVSVSLEQSGPCGIIHYPTAFTPNNDGVNDYFRPPDNTIAKNYIFQIYNRWGAKLFTSNNVSKGWDGMWSGKPQPFGTYYWVASYVTDNGETKNQSGYVCLIR